MFKPQKSPSAWDVLLPKLRQLDVLHHLAWICTKDTKGPAILGEIKVPKGRHIYHVNYMLTIMCFLFYICCFVFVLSIVYTYIVFGLKGFFISAGRQISAEARRAWGCSRSPLGWRTPKSRSGHSKSTRCPISCSQSLPGGEDPCRSSRVQRPCILTTHRKFILFHPASPTLHDFAMFEYCSNRTCWFLKKQHEDVILFHIFLSPIISQIVKKKYMLHVHQIITFPKFWNIIQQKR